MNYYYQDKRSLRKKKAIKSMIVDMKDNKGKGYSQIAEELSRELELDKPMTRQLAYYHYKTGKELTDKGEL